ncbi:MAG: hypothetical protein DSY80_04990, partial [Desulfocapsa sp.]
MTVTAISEYRHESIKNVWPTVATPTLTDAMRENMMQPYPAQQYMYTSKPLILGLTKYLRFMPNGASTYNTAPVTTTNERRFIDWTAAVSPHLQAYRDHAKRTNRELYLVG